MRFRIIYCLGSAAEGTGEAAGDFAEARSGEAGVFIAYQVGDGEDAPGKGGDCHLRLEIIVVIVLGTDLEIEEDVLPGPVGAGDTRCQTIVFHQDRRLVFGIHGVAIVCFGVAAKKVEAGITGLTAEVVVVGTGAVVVEEGAGAETGAFRA